MNESPWMNILEVFLTKCLFYGPMNEIPFNNVEKGSFAKTLMDVLRFFPRLNLENSCKNVCMDFLLCDLNWNRGSCF